MKTPQYVIILFYKFTKIDDPEQLMHAQRELCESLELKGRMLIAAEGINATFEGTRMHIDAYKAALGKDERFSDIVIKESEGNGMAFPKLSIKVRDEVVTLGVGELDIANDTAKSVTAEELEEWYKEDRDFVILDLRNDYEIASGKFDRTCDAGLRNFRDLPERLDAIKDLKDRTVVPVCTGGIRCEKATAYLKQKGFTDMYQLKDGIHTYMQKFPSSHFKGTLFVFDDRITTPVVDTEAREVIGVCRYCARPTEHYANDDRTTPSTKLLCCPSCFRAHAAELREMVDTMKKDA